MKSICICGGGNLGHVVAGFLAAQDHLRVNLLTRHPERWSSHLCIHSIDGTDILGTLNKISSRPDEVISDADIVLLCLPGFSIPSVLQQIKEVLPDHTAVGSIVSSTGFFFEAMRLLPEHTPLFGFQRVPFIARTQRYGAEASLLGYKQELQLAVERTDQKERLREDMEEMFHTPVSLMKNYLEVSLSNSNPLLHPARLYDLWHQWEPGVPVKPEGFYAAWTDNASRIYMAMDGELQSLLEKLPVSSGCIPTVLQYYDSHDAASLTRKLRSIEAFQNIMTPVRQTPDGWMPDFDSRYFMEDFPYGLRFIRQLAHEHNTPSSTIDKVYEWGIHIQESHGSRNTADITQ